MKTFAALVLGCVLALAALPLKADGTLNAYGKYGAVLTSQPLDAASSSFSVTLGNPATVKGVYGLMTVWACVTDADNSVSAITMSCTGSHDNGTTDYTLQDCTTAAGVCTSNSASWVRDPSGMTTKCWPWRVDIEGIPQVECTFTDTGGAAADLLNVTLSFAVKG